MLTFWPGQFDVGHSKALYRNFLIPRLKSLLRDKGLSDSLRGLSTELFVDNPFYPMLMAEVLCFIRRIRYIYVKETQGEVLADRPDLHLGRLLSMFAFYADPADLGFKSGLKVDDLDPLTRAIYDSLNKKQPVRSFLSGNLSCLTRLGQTLLPQHYEILLNVIKHSQLDNKALADKDRRLFFENYVDNSFMVKPFSKVEPKNLDDSLKLIEFCALGSLLGLSREPVDCQLFQPTVTAKGLCHTFNGLPMTEVYKQNELVDLWTKVFEPNESVEFKNPVGYGPNNGLYIVLNMFKTDSIEGTSKNSILSITNENEWVNVFGNYFIIQPGNSYTFKVTANRMITTKRFDDMKFEDRNCHLPHETKDSYLMKNYFKGSCLYECAVKQIIEKCNCTSWNFPKYNLSTPPFCEGPSSPSPTITSACFDQVFSSLSSKKCDCPSNCVDTAFTVFDFVQALDNPGLQCNDFQVLDKTKGVYPYNVLCGLCRKALRLHRIQFQFTYLQFRSANPDNFPEFCNQFLKNNIALIKVEMAAPGLLLSVRDTRTNFESQLSSLGKLQDIVVVPLAGTFLPFVSG